jgi:hypothetical protein
MSRHETLSHHGDEAGTVHGDSLDSRFVQRTRAGWQPARELEQPFDCSEWTRSTLSTVTEVREAVAGGGPSARHGQIGTIGVTHQGALERRFKAPDAFTVCKPFLQKEKVCHG